MNDSLKYANYLGLPFLNKGRTRGGIDCWGLMVLVYKEMYKIDLPSFGDEYVTVEDREFMEALINHRRDDWYQIPKGTEKEGDGMLLRVHGTASHIALVVTPRWMLHIERGIGSICQNYTAPNIERRIEGFYRHVKMGDFAL